VTWIRRAGKKEIWHAVLDVWDSHTLCGLPVRLKSDYVQDPSRERCPSCEEKTKTTGMGSPVQD